MKLQTVALVIFTSFIASGCAPSMSPLYRDYTWQAEPPVEVDVQERIREALADAGWSEQPSRLPNVIVTEPRPVNNWLLYRTVVSIEAAPVDDKHIRVFFHPYRKYVTGGRSKVPFLPRSIRSGILRELNEAFAENGLVTVGRGEKRDRPLGRY